MTWVLLNRKVFNQSIDQPADSECVLYGGPNWTVPALLFEKKGPIPALQRSGGGD